jgi:predicted lipid-binding transport protein (Tim44 family)
MFAYFFFVVILIAVVVIAYWVYTLYDRKNQTEWSSGLASFTPSRAAVDEDAPVTRPPITRRSSVERGTLEAALEELRARDDRFSRALFEDFLYALFAEVHMARGSKRIDLLAPYCAPNVLEHLRERETGSVRDVIVGSMRLEGASADASAGRVRVNAVFTANFSEGQPGAELGLYTEERWELSRSADARSRTPERAAIIGCPSCGGALDKLVAGKCKYCGETTASQDFDWRVERIEAISLESRGPLLTGTTEEAGTDTPTRVAREARGKLAALGERDPTFSWSAFVARVELVFHAFHEAWSKQELAGVRPYLSDALFGTQRYWVLAYKAQHLRNITADRNVLEVVLARVLADAFFDSITVRVYARCRDFTLDEADRVVAGSKTDARRYSEYWTFLRAKGASGAARSEAVCPSCGAPAAGISMAGTCGSCSAKITMGEFDWVLSRIEQDEVFELG